MLLGASRQIELTLRTDSGETQPPGPRGPAATPESDPNLVAQGAALAPIAGANFPAPQALSLVLTPPPSPLAPIAGANFPAPQALSLVLTPPPSPLAPIAGANFPAPQALSLVLVPGSATEPAAVSPTPATAIASTPTSGSGTYTAQIVQVIPRRGANFFDRNDPTGQATVQVARAALVGGGGGGSGACAAGAGSGAVFTPRLPTGREVCHTLRVSSDPGGLGDVLGLHTAEELELFFTAGANLSANLVFRGPPPGRVPTAMGTYTGTNNSTFSISGNLTVPIGSVPAGTLIRAAGSKAAVFSVPQNFSLCVYLPGGVVEYRQANGQCN